jgi:tripartite-type tricarboxylate transporter receptor subunit TctC
MPGSRVLAACLFALFAGNAHAQNFPARPVKLICPFPQGSAPDLHLRPFAQITSKYLGQPVVVENNTNWNNNFPPAEMARIATPDGYTLSLLSISAFRQPHMRKVSWDPIKDFTYIIGVGGYTFGVVVKADSPIKSLKELIDHAKRNPGGMRYGSTFRGSTPHLAMEELALIAGARFSYVTSNIYSETARALNDGSIMAMAELTAWGPAVDAGTFRLLATFGEQRSRWNAPTAQELGFNVVSYSPFGIAGPKGMDPKVTKVLHDAFYRALDDPEYDKLIRRLDMVDWYKSSEDYAEWAIDQFKFQRSLIERTIGLGRN